MKGDYSNKYCDRIPKVKKQTCQQLGLSKDFCTRMVKSPAQVENMKAYKRMHSRIKYWMITKEKFGVLRSATKKQAALCERSDVSISELKRFFGN